MILNADVKSLEWITYLFISQDKNGIQEWFDFVDNPKLNDIHTKNQHDLSLLSRLISKVFLLQNNSIYWSFIFLSGRDIK